MDTDTRIYITHQSEQLEAARAEADRAARDGDVLAARRHEANFHWHARNVRTALAILSDDQ